MRSILALLLLLATPFASADESAAFLDALCLRGFDTTRMPRAEAARFCSCVSEDVVPRLTAAQLRVLSTEQQELNGGRATSTERSASSGIRDLVVAGQARCEAAFYPPSQPINIAAGQLQLTVRCDSDTKRPEAFVYGRGLSLLSKEDERALDERMMKGQFRPEYARVTLAFDGRISPPQRWEIDVSGEIVASPDADDLIGRLRGASKLGVTIERSGRRYSEVFAATGRIPVRWTPCGGIR